MKSTRTGMRAFARALCATLACLALAAVAAPAAGAAAEADWLFDPNTVVELDLGLSPAAIEALEAEPDEYQCGTFQAKVGGVVQGPPLGNVGIRLKGSHGSFREISEKPGFKIKFNECVKKQKFFGLEKLTLNNMVQDPSMLHEVFSYDLFRAMDVPAPRAGYTFTRLNGEPIGVQANVETYDPISLPAWFASTQHLYEADIFNVDVLPGGAADFEVDEGDDADISDLEALIAAANDETGDWSEGMAAVADLTEMTRMWAVERYIGHWDGYAGGLEPAELRPNNYYLHSDDSGVFAMIPWGADQTWNTHLQFDETAGGMLFNECYADASCEALYKDALEDLQTLVGTLELPSKGERLSELLAPCQALELESRREYSAAEIAAGVEEALEFVDSRSIPLDIYLDSTTPPNPPETADPATDEPCSPRPVDPDPETNPGSKPGSGSGSAGSTPPPAIVPPPVRKSLSIGSVKLRGANVVVEVMLPGAGAVEQRVTAKLGKRRSFVCSVRKSRETAGPLKLQCPLPRWAQHRRELSSLPLSVRVSFTPNDGDPTQRTRGLAAPRLPNS